MTDDFVQSIGQKICEFPHISHAMLYKIIPVTTDYQQVITSYEYEVMNPKSSQSSEYTFTKQPEKIYTNICQVSNGSCVLDRKRILIIDFIQQ
jgi:hypothetical protein